MPGASRGQAGAEFAMVVTFLFAFGVMGVQFLGLALTSAKVSHAAQEAAYVAGSNLEAAGERTPCWAVSGGLSNPDGYSDAAICRTVLENLGNVNPAYVTVSVSPSLVARSHHSAVHVIVTYAEPVSSPLLRVFTGGTFSTSADAGSWTN